MNSRAGTVMLILPSNDSVTLTLSSWCEQRMLPYWSMLFPNGAASPLYSRGGTVHAEEPVSSRTGKMLELLGDTSNKLETLPCTLVETEVTLTTNSPTIGCGWDLEVAGAKLSDPDARVVNGSRFMVVSGPVNLSVSIPPNRMVPVASPGLSVYRHV